MVTSIYPGSTGSEQGCRVDMDFEDEKAASQQRDGWLQGGH